MALDRYALTPDFKAVIGARHPGVTENDWQALGTIMAADGLICDDGVTPRPAFVRWCQGVGRT